MFDEATNAQTEGDIFRVFQAMDFHDEKNSISLFSDIAQITNLPNEVVFFLFSFFTNRFISLQNNKFEMVQS